MWKLRKGMYVRFLILLFICASAFHGLDFPIHVYGTPSKQDQSVDQLDLKPSSPALITGITQNLLTVVSFLVGTTSFVLGLTIQNAPRLTSTMKSYFRTMILALLVPAIVIITYGIIVTAYAIDPGDEHYLLLLFALYVPSGAILFLLRKLHPIN